MDRFHFKIILVSLSYLVTFGWGTRLVVIIFGVNTLIK